MVKIVGIANPQAGESHVVRLQVRTLQIDIINIVFTRVGKGLCNQPLFMFSQNANLVPVNISRLEDDMFVMVGCMKFV